MFTCVDFEYVRTIDGDTVVVNIYLGLEIWLRDQHIRIMGINTPEIYGSEKDQGLLSKDRVIELMKSAKFLQLADQRDKYGRLLGDLILENNQHLSDTLVKEGLAIYKRY